MALLQRPDVQLLEQCYAQPSPTAGVAKHGPGAAHVKWAEGPGSYIGFDLLPMPPHVPDAGSICAVLAAVHSLATLNITEHKQTRRVDVYR